MGPFGRDPAPTPLQPLVEPAVFLPSFERVEAYGPSWYFDEAMRRIGWARPRRYLDPRRFADSGTADWVASTFDGLEVYERVAGGNEGPFFTASSKERWVRFRLLDEKRKPRLVGYNAGFLADAYARNTGLQFILDQPGAGHYELVPGGISKGRHENGLRAVRALLSQPLSSLSPVQFEGMEEGGGGSTAGG